MGVLVLFGNSGSVGGFEEKVSGEVSFWNLKKISFEDFIDKVKAAIPPASENLSRLNYDLENKNPPFGMTKREYKELSFAMLLPITDQFFSEGDFKILCTLFLGKYFPPFFIVTELGFHRCNKRDPLAILIHNSEVVQSLFDDVKFGRFLCKISPIIKSIEYNPQEIKNWGENEWRIFFSLELLGRLSKYFSSKHPLLWAEEFASVSAIFDLLLIATEESSSGEKLKKRIAIVVDRYFSECEKTVKDMYLWRSEFVHGSFFKRLHIETDSEDFSQVTIEENVFRESELIEDILRLVIVTSLLFYRENKSKQFHKIVADSIGNNRVAEKIREKSEEAYGLIK